MNYHEMTMDEPKDSPQKKKQFAVTCTVIGGVFVYMLATSGALQAVEPIQGKFPGGNYVYKYAVRDYASSGGLGRGIMQDLINTQIKEKKEIVPQYKLEPHVHHLYLDNPNGKGGYRQRFMSGLLSPKSKQGNDETVELLMGLNDETKRSDFTKEELHTMTAQQVFGNLPYEVAELPAVNALVLQFPWTGGISSMLVQVLKVSFRRCRRRRRHVRFYRRRIYSRSNRSFVVLLCQFDIWKLTHWCHCHFEQIIPKMHKLAAEKLDGQQTVVISACSKEEQMCTHYAPLVDVQDFLLGRPTTKDFNDALGKEDIIDWHGMGLTYKYGKKKVMQWTGLGKKQATVENEAKEEL